MRKFVMGFGLFLGLSFGLHAFAERCQTLLAPRLEARLPEHIRAITNTTYHMSGPNCLNGVLLWHSLVKKPRRVRSHEFEAWLKNEAVFKKRTNRKQLKFGDVVVFRLGPEDRIFHAAIWLNSEWFWQKEDTWKESPWEIVSAKEVFAYNDEFFVEYYSKVDKSALEP